MSKFVFQKKISFIFGSYILACSMEGIITIPLVGNILQLPEIIFLVFAGFFFLNINKIDFQNFNLIKIDYALIVYAIAVLLSWLTTQKTNAFGEVLGIIYFLSFYSICNLVFVNYFNEINAKKLVLVSGTLAAFFGIIGWGLLYYFNNDSLAMLFQDYPLLGDTIRVKGLLRGPILLADFLAIAFIIILLLNKFEWRKFNNWGKLGLMIILVGLFMTKTKSILLVYFVLIWAAFQYQILAIPKLPRSILKLSAWGALFFYLITSHMFLLKKDDPRFFQKLNSPYSSCKSYETPFENFVIVPSVYSSQKALALIAGVRHIPFGIGGNELINYNQEIYEEEILPCQNTLTPHSTYFGAFGELGIFGFCILIFLLVIIYQTILTCQFSTNQRVFAMALFIYIALQGITTDFMNFRHYWLLLIFLALIKRAKMKESSSLPFFN